MAETDKKAVWPGWETVRLIGRGSFGAVYEIERDVFGHKEKAALKVITIPQNDSDIEELYDSGYDEASVSETFRSHLESIIREYTLMREMNGAANVVNCDDFRIVPHEEGIGWDIFIRMELLTALPRALGKDVPEDQVIRIAEDLCRALILCRKYDIIHRDIKPQNIFVSRNGDYKLGDFGIAKTMEKTSGGTKIGTYKYMAPEVYNNRPYNHTADIYSLGLVLYWLLNERRSPFMPLPPAAATALLEEEARRKRFEGMTLPAPAHGSEALKKIVLKACAYDPKDRYQSAEEMLEDLRKLEGEAVFPERPSLVEDTAGGTIGPHWGEKPSLKEDISESIIQREKSKDSTSISPEIDSEVNESTADDDDTSAPTMGAFSPRTDKNSLPPDGIKDTSSGMKRKPVGLIAAAVLLCLAAVMAFVFPWLIKDDSISIGSADDRYDDSSTNDDFDFSSAKAGDIICFGHYEQDNDLSNGPEEIRWLVLDKQDGKILVISQFALDSKQYNEELVAITWEECSLRSWLNDSFLNSAFSDAEFALILKSNVSADKNPFFTTDPGRSTLDKIFLLSVSEVNDFFNSDNSRQCRGTAYCRAQGVYKAENGYCSWWLRSPGDNPGNAAGVKGDGSFDSMGHIVSFSNYGVRPALWIDLGS